MTLLIDDTGDRCKLTITSGTKTLLKRKGKSIKSLLKFVYENTQKQNVKQSIMELKPMLQFMEESLTTIKIGK